MIQIAVLGYGTVGSGVVEVINRNQESINKKAGEEINIKYVLDLRDFPGDPVQEKIVHDYEVIANDPEIKIVVEVMGGTNPAYTFVKRALESGKSVCTSNKELVAKHGVELIRIAKELRSTACSLAAMPGRRRGKFSSGKAGTLSRNFPSGTPRKPNTARCSPAKSGCRRPGSGRVNPRNCTVSGYETRKVTSWAYSGSAFAPFWRRTAICF